MLGNSKPAPSNKKKYCVKFSNLCCNKFNLNQKSRWSILNLFWRVSPCTLITFDTKYPSKLIYTLVNLVLNTLQSLLNFYFWIRTVIHIVSIFSSTVWKICTDCRCNLGKDATQIHTATNVYTETISIKNNLLGILIPK